ncbi:Flp family type IVb pilin [Parerythrobacter jejuensis]|uniref:Flp family type IVb pilin n=1 Tax=Parerythrobacter jejuensis TaxID=795812 RepID=A0A845ARY8_9SPHN|nr:Flp family type IVb pilin [Parerythrobacter jejuensis]MXP32147.1 Flp family type IVb pilin [Parerythrobacter jejuensis]
MRNFLKRVLADDAGATAIEYGLILALVFLAMVTAVQGVGNETINLWNDISQTSADAIASGGV